MKLQWLVTRVERLERKADAPRTAFSVVVFPKGDEKAKQRAFVQATLKFMYVPDFESDEAWERAAELQQRHLLTANATRK